MENTKKDFQQLSTLSEILNFLEDKGNNHNSYYHYTNLESAIKIISGKSFLLTRGNAHVMNDQHECNVKGTQQNWDRTYLASFSFGDSENMAMWGLYCLPWEDAVRISIPKKAMQTWINSINKIYEANFINSQLIKRCINSSYKKTLSDIIYIDGKRDDISSKLYWTNKSLAISRSQEILEIGSQPQMTGFIKNAAWKYENEVRLNIKLDNAILCEKIAVDIPPEVIDNITITAGPYFQGDIENRIREEIPNVINNVQTTYSGFKGLVNYRTLCSICNNKFIRRR